MMSRRLCAALGAAILVSACSDVAALRRSSGVGVSPAPSEQWKPAPAAVPPQPPRENIAIPEFLQKAGAVVELDQVIDVALRNNPATRAAWLQAQAAAAEVGSKRSAYFPEIDLGAQLARQKQAGAGRTTLERTSWGPSAVLSYLLFDFGGRSAQLEQARDTLIAADYNHNATIQNVVLRVAQAYYGYLNARALLEAQQATVKEMQANYDAAEARHRAGVVTIADVLQAKTALSQAELGLESISGSVAMIQGALATAAGLPATLQFEVGVLPAKIPTAAVARDIEELIARAEAQRPDLLAMRALAERAHARVGEMRSAALPALSVAASGNRAFYDSLQPANNWNAVLLVHFPLFTGYRSTYDIRQAQAEAAAADAQALSVQQQIDLQVWTSYYELKTAARRVTVSRDLLASAEESERVAAGRYKEGVGSILDLLTAQTALESARALEITARSDWFLALAQLAHDIGSIDFDAVAAAPITETK
jgi:outer membrane protein